MKKNNIMKSFDYDVFKNQIEDKSCLCILDHIRYDKRPCFLINGMQYVSAGVLFWTEKNGIYYLMVQRSYYPEGHIIEDFGGKSDISDKCIRDVAIRECLEELNFKISERDIKIKSADLIYLPLCKYLLYLVFLEPEYMTIYNPELFGKEELHEHINRTVEWISYKNYIYEYNNLKLNPRLSQCTNEILIKMIGYK